METDFLEKRKELLADLGNKLTFPKTVLEAMHQNKAVGTDAIKKAIGELEEVALLFDQLLKTYGSD